MTKIVVLLNDKESIEAAIQHLRHDSEEEIASYHDLLYLMLYNPRRARVVFQPSPPSPGLLKSFVNALKKTKLGFYRVRISDAVLLQFNAGNLKDKLCSALGKLWGLSKITFDFYEREALRLKPLVHIVSLSKGLTGLEMRLSCRHDGDDFLLDGLQQFQALPCLENISLDVYAFGLRQSPHILGPLLFPFRGVKEFSIEHVRNGRAHVYVDKGAMHLYLNFRGCFPKRPDEKSSTILRQILDQNKTTIRKLKGRLDWVPRELLCTFPLEKLTISLDTFQRPGDENVLALLEQNLTLTKLDMKQSPYKLPNTAKAFLRLNELGPRVFQCFNHLGLLRGPDANNDWLDFFRPIRKKLADDSYSTDQPLELSLCFSLLQENLPLIIIEIETQRKISEPCEKQRLIHHLENPPVNPPNKRRRC